jgi:hypothetical protein
MENHALPTFYQYCEYLIGPGGALSCNRNQALAAANERVRARCSGDLLPPSPPAEKAKARQHDSIRLTHRLAKVFGFFSSVETRLRNSFMTL